MNDLEALQAKLGALSEAYAAHLPDKIRQIEQAWTDLPQDSFDETGLATMHRLVHSLTGSGKTFGFPLLSEVARSLEGEIEALVLAKAVPSEAQRQNIQQSLQKLQGAAAQR